jgi:nicotinamide-nucleotide adenylyltransferase
MKIGFFIGRFQPAHKWHLQALLDMHTTWINHFVIGVWSAQKERTEENPFTYIERKKILESLLWDQPFSYEIHAVPDVGNDEQWFEYVVHNLPHFDVVLSWNPWLEGIFKPKWYEMYIPTITVEIKGTNTRKAIALWDKEYIDKAMNDEVYAYLLSIDAPKRLQWLMPNLYKYVIRYTTTIAQKDWTILQDIVSFDWVANLPAHEQIIRRVKDTYALDIEIDHTQPIWQETYNPDTNTYIILLTFKSIVL